MEYSYSRLLGTRGAACRLCPREDMGRLSKKAVKRWEWAETYLREYLGQAPQHAEVVEVARRVEDGWADSIERYVLTLSSRMHETETAEKIGILKGIDTVSLHLAQREAFALSAVVRHPAGERPRRQAARPSAVPVPDPAPLRLLPGLPRHPELPPDVSDSRPGRLPLVVRGLPPDRAAVELDLPAHPRRRAGLAVLAPGDGPYNEERLFPRRDRVGEQSPRLLMGKVLPAGKEPQKRTALPSLVIADRPAQHRIARFQSLQNRPRRHRTLHRKLHLIANSCQRPQMGGQCDSDHHGDRHWDHGSVWTSTDSTGGRSRTMGVQVSPLSGEA